MKRTSVRLMEHILGFSFPGSLMFVGMCISALGLRYREPVLTVFGGVWILVVALVFLRRVPKVLLGTLGGVVGGALVGILLGQFAGNVAELLFGVMAGMLLGAISGGVIAAGIIAGLGIFGEALADYLPTVTGVMFLLGAAVGAVLGVTHLREILPRAFGSVGGGAIVGGTLGMIVGSYVMSEQSSDS